MHYGTFDLFKIGVGPSSSHTMGPMSAACDFVTRLEADSRLGGACTRLVAELYGSLALTGKGHATDRAVILGLCGVRPDRLDPDHAERTVAEARARGRLRVAGLREIAFDEARDLLFHHRESLPLHPNGMRFSALAADGAVLASRVYYSIGGGAFVEEVDGAARELPGAGGESAMPVPYPYRSAEELLRVGERTGLRIADIARANDRARFTDAEITARLGAIREAMSACIERGMATPGTLPGGLRVKRRAPEVLAKLRQRGVSPAGGADPLQAIDWVHLWALAVNEENAAGGRVVTAPTNGAAGIVPAVLRYYETYVPGAGAIGAEEFLLTAAAIGALFEMNASISGAEVGCQGEVGVACSMAAAGLAAAMGASNAQIENAAEIGMEHNLGLTCDPVGGLVQVPCIERNAIGAVKAIEAARLALLGDGTHRVTLDQVIETMRRTGLDMHSRYKETAQGGLAVNVVEC